MATLYDVIMDALRDRDDIERRIRETLDEMHSMKYEDELERRINQIMKEENKKC